MKTREGSTGIAIVDEIGRSRGRAISTRARSARWARHRVPAAECRPARARSGGLFRQVPQHGPSRREFGKRPRDRRTVASWGAPWGRVSQSCGRRGWTCVPRHARESPRGRDGIDGCVQDITKGTQGGEKRASSPDTAGRLIRPRTAQIVIEASGRTRSSRDLHALAGRRQRTSATNTSAVRDAIATHTGRRRVSAVISRAVPRALVEECADCHVRGTLAQRSRASAPRKTDRVMIRARDHAISS